MAGTAWRVRGRLSRGRSGMRTFGVVCVALGILLLVFSWAPIIGAENPTQLALGLGCAGFVALPLLILGIVLTRRTAAKAGREGEARDSDAALQRASKVLEFL